MKDLKKNQKKYEFFHKTIFFPKEGILVIGDLHIGYEQALRDSGILVPERQVQDIIFELKKIIEIIKNKGYFLREVVFLGDIKHLFKYVWKEKDNFNKVVNFLEKYVLKNKVILIRGNHDTMEINQNLKLKDYYIKEDVVFLHGHKNYPEIFEKKINFVVTGHLHPSIILTEMPGVKSEAYKCFLEGNYKGKKCIVIPSFIGFVEGTPINDYKEAYLESFSIIPKKEILNFRVHVLGDEKVYEFGRIKNIDLLKMGPEGI